MPAHQLETQKEGYLYVIYDGFSGLAKIGRTKRVGRRQRAIMSSHGHVLVNILNAKVDDQFAVESQVHQHFKSERKGGEWFAADLSELVMYVHRCVDWIQLDMECPARVFQYLLAAKNGDYARAKAALVE